MSMKQSLRKRNPVIKAARKRVYNQIDADIEINNNGKRRRLEMFTIDINKRHFHHIQTLDAFAIENNNLADDSADDDEYKLLYQHIHRMELNQYRFLNDGEKQLINLWNTFIEDEECLALKHMQITCHRFIDAHIRDVFQKQLYRNLLLHFCVLCDHGLLKSSGMMSLVQHIQKYMGIEAFESIVKARQQKIEQKKKRSKSPTKEITLKKQQNERRYVLRSVNSTALG